MHVLSHYRYVTAVFVIAVSAQVIILPWSTDNFSGDSGEMRLVGADGPWQAIQFDVVCVHYTSVRYYMKIKLTLPCSSITTFMDGQVLVLGQQYRLASLDQYILRIMERRPLNWAVKLLLT